MFLRLVIASFIVILSLVQCKERNVKYRSASVGVVETLKGLKAKSGRPVFEFSTDLLTEFSHVPYSERNSHLFILFNALDEQTNCQVCG